MSAAVAEDLRHLAEELAANELPAGLSPSRCAAPPVPVSCGARDTAASCLEPVATKPRLVSQGAQPAPRPPRCPDVTAKGRDGGQYAGNLLYDILLYRSLRARQMDGTEPCAADKTTLVRLDAQLRPAKITRRDDGRALRQFSRWETGAMPGVGLTVVGGPATQILPVETVDLSAGGICVVTELTLSAGDEITVRVAGSGEDSGRMIALQARVAWSRGRKVGLMFAGGPAWD